MFLAVCQYLLVFGMSAFLFNIFQKTFRKVYFVSLTSKKSRLNNCFGFSIMGCLSIFPIIAMHGLRYGIGTDYFSYERAYNVLHVTNFAKYLTNHRMGVGQYYVEILYYVMNRIFPSYRMLIWGLGILIFALLCYALKDYATSISYPFALFIFLCTQFIYSMNGTRFVVALCFILLSYIALSKDKIKTFVVFILLAALFHKSSLFCLAMFFLKKYKVRETNSLRNIFLFFLILFFPFISEYLLRFAGTLSIFERYFTTATYMASEEMRSGWMWIFHIIPPLLPLIVLCRKEINEMEDTMVFFRICIMEVPFRMLGLYNTWYTRFSRCAQICQVVFIPLVLGKIKNRNKRMLLYAYYILWYIFYFTYYAIVNDRGDSLPYVWVFSQH